jgi:hypothetical protein
MASYTKILRVIEGRNEECLKAEEFVRVSRLSELEEWRRRATGEGYHIVGVAAVQGTEDDPEAKRNPGEKARLFALFVSRRER